MPRVLRTDATGLAAPETPYGEILLSRPLHFNHVLAFTVTVLLGVFALFIFGQYAQRTTVTGQVLPDVGLLHLHAPQASLILSREVSEGQFVKQGQVLYVLSGERYSDGEKPLHGLVVEQLLTRRRLVNSQLDMLTHAQQRDHELLLEKIASFESEKEEVQRILVAQQRRLDISNSILARSQRAVNDGFVGVDEVERREIAVLESVAQLEATRRNALIVRRELAELVSRSVAGPSEYEDRAIELQKERALLEQQLAEQEIHRRVTIVAPASGTVTGVLGEAGQTVDPSLPIATLVPEAATLLGHLYVPGNAIGWIKAGETVPIRYTAYSGHRQGRLSARIRSISTAAIAMDTVTAMTHKPRPVTKEALYLVIVDLPSQHVEVDGEYSPLYPGMGVEAEIPGRSRHLYEWILGRSI